MVFLVLGVFNLEFWGSRFKVIGMSLRWFNNGLGLAFERSGMRDLMHIDCPRGTLIVYSFAS